MEHFLAANSVLTPGVYVPCGLCIKRLLSLEMYFLCIYTTFTMRRTIKQGAAAREQIYLQCRELEI